MLSLNTDNADSDAEAVRSSLAAASRLRNLQTLRLTLLEFTPGILDELEGLSHVSDITTFDMIENSAMGTEPRLTDEDVAFVSSWNSLESVLLHGKRLTYRTVIDLARLPNVRKLSVHKTRNPTNEGIDVLESLPGFRLRRLEFGNAEHITLRPVAATPANDDGRGSGQ